jgi:hypothetical protein
MKLRVLLGVAAATMAIATLGCSDSESSSADGGAGAGGSGQGGVGAMGQGGTGNMGQGGIGTGGAGGSGPPDPPCDTSNFSAAAQLAEVDAELLYYEGASSTALPASYLTFELYFMAGANSGVHSFTFTGENYQDAHTTAVLYETCDAGDLCDATYLVTEGVLDITATGNVGDTLTGTLTNAKFAQVDFDASDNSTWVTNGAGWCIDTYSFSTTLIAP